MGDDFDRLMDDLQAQIFEETRQAYGDIAFERWQNLKFMGRIDLPDGYASVTGSCGDTIEIFLRFGNGRAKEATFQTDGCGASAVCGSFAAELAIGKTLEEVAEITGKTILDTLGDLPKEDEHCAHLAADALRASLENYLRLHRKKAGTSRHPVEKKAGA